MTTREKTEMNALAPAYGLDELVRFEAQDVEARIAKAPRHRSFFDFCLSRVGVWVARQLARRVEKFSQQLASQVLGLEGTRNKIINSNDYRLIDESGELVQILEKLRLDFSETGNIADRYYTGICKRGDRVRELTDALKRYHLVASDGHYQVGLLIDAIVSHDSRGRVCLADVAFQRLMESAKRMESGILYLSNPDESELDADLLAAARSSLQKFTDTKI